MAWLRDFLSAATRIGDETTNPQASPAPDREAAEAARHAFRSVSGAAGTLALHEISALLAKRFR